MWSSFQRRIVRDEWSGQVADPFRARAKILEMFKAAAGSNESFGDDQSFQHHSLAGSIGVVVNKVLRLLSKTFRNCAPFLKY